MANSGGQIRWQTPLVSSAGQFHWPSASRVRGDLLWKKRSDTQKFSPMAGQTVAATARLTGSPFVELDRTPPALDGVLSSSAHRLPSPFANPGSLIHDFLGIVSPGLAMNKSRKIESGFIATRHPNTVNRLTASVLQRFGIKIQEPVLALSWE